MKTTNQKGFSAVEVIIVIVILGIIAGIGWFVWQKQKDSSKDSASDTPATSQKSTENTTASSLPNGYTAYKSSTPAFNFAYPKEWGTAEHSSQSTLSHYAAVTPEVSDIFLGSAQLTDRLTIATTGKDDFTITTAKYGATLKPTSAGGWTVSEVNPADTTDKVGDSYAATSFENAQGVTVYDFYWQDEGTSHAVWVFAASDEFATLRLPGVYTTGETGYAETSATDLANYKALAKKIADTIETN